MQKKRVEDKEMGQICVALSEHPNLTSYIENNVAAHLRTAALKYGNSALFFQRSQYISFHLYVMSVSKKVVVNTVVYYYCVYYEFL